MSGKIGNLKIIVETKVSNGFYIGGVRQSYKSVVVVFFMPL